MQPLLFNQCLSPQPPHFPRGVSPPLSMQKPPPSPKGGPGGDPPARGGTWAEAGASLGAARAPPAPHPGWYLCHSLGSIKRDKLFPGLISRPCSNLRARPPVIPPPWEGVWLSAGERLGQRGPHPCLIPTCGCWGDLPPNQRTMGTAKPWSPPLLAHLAAA